MHKNQLKTAIGTSILNFVLLGSAYAGGDGPGREAVPGRNAGEIIEILGITTLSCLLLTVILGMLMPKKRKLLFPWHKRLGFTALILGIIHGGIVLLFF